MFRKDAINFINYTSQINKELKNSNLYNMENYIYNYVKSMILNNDINNKEDYIFNLLLFFYHNSYTFKLIFIENSDLKLYVYYYVRKIFDYYEYLFKDNEARFDKFIEIISKTPKDSEIVRNNLLLDLDDIQKTLHLLNESIRKYYEIYNNKTLITEYSNDEIIRLNFAEANLAHVLGIKVNSIASDKKYADMLHLSNEDIEVINNPANNIEKYNEVKLKILYSLVDLDKGNLLEFEKDRLKKLAHYKYEFYDYNSVKETLINYSKIYARCKAFIDFKPFEEVSMALKFPIGYKLIRESTNLNSQRIVLLTKNDISSTYKYSTLLTNYDIEGDRRYFESLLIKKPDEINTYVSDSVSAISTSVALTDETGQGPVKEFSKEEQLKLVELVSNDIDNIDLTDIMEYINNRKTLYKKW